VIVDASAMLAILLEEPDAFTFFRALSVAKTAPVMAAPSLAETMITIERKGGNVASLERLLRVSKIVIRDFTPQHAVAAWQAFRQFGKGRHAADLNFGDCMTYAFAKVEQLPLLFKGQDFAQTDIQPALNS
jgi:ribonuclease VapC